MLAEHSTSPPLSKSQSSADELVDLARELTLCERLVRALLVACLQPWDLGYVEFLVLGICARAPVGGTHQRDLVAATGASAAHLSGMVEQLRRRGWLVAERGPQDRRQQIWRLADEGRRWFAELQAALAATAEKLSQRISSPELAGLRGCLQGLLAAVESQPQLNIFRSDPVATADDGPEPGGAA
jgi:DNA-binding MarR family transcriptional regulator